MYDQKCQVLMCSAIPIGLPSSGSIAANGALTLTTGLQVSFYEAIWLYFPAGAVFSGSPAGFYFVVMSSTTLGTVYGNRYTTGIPKIPDVLQPIIDPGPGAYTQVTTRQTFINLTIPGNTLQPSSAARFTGVINNPNNANNKSLFLLWGAQDSISINVTTSLSTAFWKMMFARPFATARQVSGGNSVLNGGSGTQNSIQYTNDITAPIATGFAGQLANAADFLILDALLIELLLGP